MIPNDLRSRLVDRRTLRIAALAILLGIAAGGVATILTHLIGFFTNLAFFGRLSFDEVSPADAQLGLWIIPVAVAGGLVVGLMARFGSTAIRGHGIPEAMERVLEHESRIPVRMTILKPLSSAIAIGTGGPFGAEGPIIATGGAIGSMIGQFLHTTAKERKTLLAAGAAAGMAATFGSPVSAVLLAVELLLFELSPKTLIPVILGAATGAIMGAILRGPGAAFPMPTIDGPGAEAFAFYLLLGLLVGFASIGVTWAVYKVEELFEKLPIHWMWWPALGGLAIGLIGLAAPRVLGVGYNNIRDIVQGALAAGPLAVLVAMKFLIWVIALGSGTSGGTLAPLFTIGGGLGALIGMGLAAAFPEAGIDPRVAGLVGMAAMFSGASRAVLASVVFAFETTRQPMGLVPLLGGCGAAYLVSCAFMKHSIMTKKIADRGVHVPTEYSFDPLGRVKVGDVATREVVDAPTLTVFEDDSLRLAVDVLVREGADRLAVVTRADPRQVVGTLSCADALRGFEGRMDENTIRPARRLVPTSIRQRFTFRR